MTRSSFTHSVLVTLTHFKVTGEFENMVMICVDLQVSSFSFFVGWVGARGSFSSQFCISSLCSAIMFCTDFLMQQGHYTREDVWTSVAGLWSFFCG